MSTFFDILLLFIILVELGAITYYVSLQLRHRAPSDQDRYVPIAFLVLTGTIFLGILFTNSSINLMFILLLLISCLFAMYMRYLELLSMGSGSSKLMATRSNSAANPKLDVAFQNYVRESKQIQEANNTRYADLQFTNVNDPTVPT